MRSKDSSSWRPSRRMSAHASKARRTTRAATLIPAVHRGTSSRRRSRAPLFSLVGAPGPQWAQQLVLLVVVFAHATQDAVEHGDGILDVGALVQHGALGPLAHRRIADLGAGRKSGLGKLFEHLSRPDHWKMRRLAQPKDFL